MNDNEIRKLIRLMDKILHIGFESLSTDEWEEFKSLANTFCLAQINKTKEKIWVFDYTAGNVYCFIVNADDDIEEILAKNNINIKDSIWMSTNVNVELKTIYSI